MKIRSTFHVLALLMAVLIFSMPVVTFAQQAAAEAEQRKAIADTELFCKENHIFFLLKENEP